jgi:hypothetical protein
MCVKAEINLISWGYRIAISVLFTSFPVTASLSSQDTFRDFGPEQSTGKPDTLGWGDRVTAWASKHEVLDGEWLELAFAEPVVPSAVRVVESFNPGALSEISAFSKNGEEHVIWHGEDPTPNELQRGVSLIPIITKLKTDRIRLKIASKMVAGWNEIDAVGIHGNDGSLQWAIQAEASSTFASGMAPVFDSSKPAEFYDLESIPLAARSPADELLRDFIQMNNSRDTATAATLQAKMYEVQSRVKRERTWIVVLEGTEWSTSMFDEDASLGKMVHAIFDAEKYIEVRQRVFSSPADFIAQCREAANLPGDVIVLIASHGDASGIKCRTGKIGERELSDGLSQIRNLRTVHFSACDLMSGTIPDTIRSELAVLPKFEGFSGYTNSVDWMGSAICDFTYLDLLVNRGLPAKSAAEALKDMLSFAGSKRPLASPFSALGFCFSPAFKKRPGNVRTPPTQRSGKAEEDSIRKKLTNE